MKRSPFASWRAPRLPILLLAALLAACGRPAPEFRGTALEHVAWGKDFTLTAQSGERLDTATLHGKVQILSFGYTHCPDICGPTLARLAQLDRALGADAARVQVLFVSVDPAHDTPAQLKGFLAKIDPRFIGLTGTNDEVGMVAADHMVYFKAARGARVEHTGMLFLKDARGRVRVLVKETAPLEDLLYDVRQLLRENA